ncbi:uncharacterized protein At2g33490-like [Curcuma longa]|uniref:uncharacterized protein At2g33490-like n=1 Tax=Curcuma longa TaxID=136217 RepID=UPI003D9DDD1B
MARRGNRTNETVNQPDLTHLVAELQRQITEQQQTINTLMNQQGNATPPPVNQPVIPTAPPVTPVPPTGPVPGMRPEAYLIQWQRLKPETFSGAGEPWDAQAWFKTVESIVELLDWPEHEKIKCASFCLSGDARMWWDRVKAKRPVNEMKWTDFESEFFEEFFHMRVTNKHYDEFTEFRQGDLSEYSDKAQTYFSREPRAVSMSAPLLANKKVDFSDRISQLRPASTKKYHTYALPTPLDQRKSSVAGSDKPISASRVEAKASFQRKLWGSSPLQPSMSGKGSIDLQLPSPIKLPKAHSLLKENINIGQLRIPPLHEELSMSQFTVNVSDAKKIKRQAFSGPLTSQTPSNKPILPSSIFSAIPAHINAPQPSTMAQKLSRNASPPISSPKINELHELPRPPVDSKQFSKPSFLVGHSGPLMYRSNEFTATNKLPLYPSQMASPLPTPPGAIARSFSIPSSSQRSPSVSVSELLEVPTNQNMVTDISPPLTPISLTPSQPSSESSESVNQTSKSRGKGMA